jgi:alginate O-acetyltransferase complex protein AlgJ
MRVIQLLRLSAFAAAMILPSLMMRGADLTLSNEQRTLAPRPTLYGARSQYPEQFDAYLRDHFGWRDRAVRWHNLFKFHVFHQSPVRTVLLGRNGWLFYAGDDTEVDIRDFAGRWPYRPSDLDRWLRHVNSRVRQYARLGARYLVVIAPNKQSMYPELVPAQYGPHAPGLIKAFLERARVYPGVEIMDLEPPLHLHRDTQLYFRGDSHWNARGAFYAAQAITDQLRQSLPTVGALREEDYALQTGPIESGDLVRMLGLDTKVSDQEFRYVRRTPAARNIRDDAVHRIWVRSDQPRLPKAVLFGDSYGMALAPILADAFSRLHYYRSLRGMSSGVTADLNIVRAEKPDVVILVAVERYLPALGVQ